MGELTHSVATVARQLSARKAAAQGGVISGANPSQYNINDPFPLWVIQVAIIIAMTQLLSLVLSRIRQPRVIAEVIGGVILGPTVMGRIPGFTKHVFPTAGMPMLALTSTIGLVLFLFLVGLEIDVRVIKRNAKASSLVSVAGLIVPLGMGAALGVGIYKEFIHPSVNYGYFLLFTAVAIGITAFPVLCRILTELKLLDTTVGVIVLSAGVGNDIIGWVLLALTVALVNASSGLTALWVLLAGVGYVLLVLYPGRWAYVWLARRTGSLEQGTPTAFMMTITILIVLASAFFTDIIGIHPIFGGFLAGLIIPHENGFAISLVEKLEDLVSILFLPIYFALSGLKTNLGLLNNGVTWGYTILICLVAFFSKFAACGAAARAAGFNWRESSAIGSLMSCKGLVELIVLNVGLQAGILDTRTFSMFVVHAIILTFMTTPLTLLFYPENCRVHEGTTTVRDKVRAGGGPEAGTGQRTVSDDQFKTKFALVLDKMEQLPAAMTLSQLLQPQSSVSSLSSGSFTNEKAEPLHSPTHPQITMDALRLIELSNRTSAVLKGQEAESLIHNDPVVSVFRTFGYLNRFLVSAALSVVSYDEFPSVIANHVSECDSQMVILPWSRGSTATALEDRGQTGQARNPFDGVFHKPTSHDQTSSVVYSEFIRKVFLNSPTDVALFVDRGLSVPYTELTGTHLFLPFFGGPDDRLALSFLVQLCSNASVSATVVKIVKTDALTRSSTAEDPKVVAPRITGADNTMAAADTVYPHQTTQSRLVSDTADNLIWNRFSQGSNSHNHSVVSALSRITFDTTQSSKPLHTVVELLTGKVSQPASGKALVVLAGRSRRLAVESHQAELRGFISERGSPIGSSVAKTLGDVGAALVAAGANASLFILQAAVSQ